jgi:16S rRNA (guanine527-N7)-methyltransferase
VNVTKRVAELVRIHALDPAAAPRLIALLDSIATDPLTPSSVTAPELAVDVHIADSLSALTLPQVRAARSIADVGSGAGLPGLALAIALPQARVALVESARRKCAFLERARVATAAENVEIVCSRVEEWTSGAARNDLVTARALGELALVCEYAAPLLELGGTLVAWKGVVSASERAGAARAAAHLGLELRAVVRASPYPGSAEHHFHIYVKTTETPSRFPRRPGAARKRPLGREP